jgi:hypothetical protein
VRAFLENIQNKESVCAFGVFIFLHGETPPPVGSSGLSASEALDSPVPIGDPMFLFLQRSFVDFGFHNTRRLVGLLSYDEWTEFKRGIPGYQPINTGYNPDLDWYRSNGLVANLTYLNHHGLPKQFGRDKEVWHLGFEGRLRNGTDAPLYSLGSEVTYYGVQTPTVSGLPRWYSVVFDSSGFSLGSFDYESPYVDPKWEFVSLLTALKAAGEISWSSWSLQVDDFTVEDDYVSISYTWDRDSSPYWGYYRHDSWQSRLTIGVTKPGADPVEFDDFGEYSLKSSRIFPQIRYAARSLNTWWTSPGYPETGTFNPIWCSDYTWDGEGTDYLRPILLSHPTQDRTEPPESVWRPRERLQLNKVRTFTGYRFPDLYPSAFNSSVDAFRNFSNDLSFNLYEFSSEIPELLQLIPDFRLLFRALRDYNKQRYGRVAVRLGDFLTSTYLKYQFGQLPDAQALDELNERGGVLVKAYEALSVEETVTSYGKFTYRLPDGEWPNSTACYLTTRTKAVFRASDITFVQALISLNRDGVLPTLSDLWETVPLTFVVDWFANIGGRLKDLESYALLACMDIETFEHSFEVSAKIEPTFLQSSGYVSPDDSFAYRLYARTLSLRMPALKTSGRYDFGEPQYDPNTSIVGALLFQWFFS